MQLHQAYIGYNPSGVKLAISCNSEGAAIPIGQSLPNLASPSLWLVGNWGFHALVAMTYLLSSQRRYYLQ